MSFMISLQDKITKFQKLIYNKDLEDFIPIDEQFIGGGITMESLIKQNAFIVEQLKKMKNIFVNYCKLNQTVYEKINQHQIALHSETNKILNISHSVEERLQESISQVKTMYEQMQYQTLKTEQFVNQAIKPIEQAISKKVDESSFTTHMKRIINQLQDGEIQLEQQPSQSHDPCNMQTNQPTTRKRKGKFLSHEEYNIEKQNMNKIFLQLSSKIEDLQSKNQQNDPILYKNTSSINKMTLTLDSNQTQLFKLNRESKEVRSLIHSIQQRLINEISSRTSDPVWQRKLNAFQASFVTPRYEFLTTEINKNQKENNKNFADLSPKFKVIRQQIDCLVQENRQQQSLIKFQEQTLNQSVQNFNWQFTSVQQKINFQKVQTDKKFENFQQKIDHQVSSRNKQIQNVSNKIKDLSKTIQEKVFFNVKKNIDIKITEIQKNIFALISKEKSIQQQLFHMKGEINSIKQVLSKKANFSDILLHFQRKADKEDFKQLRQKIQTAPSHLKSTILQSPERTRRTISANSRKRSSLSKNLLNTSEVMNEEKSLKEQQKQMSSRLFMIGLQNQMSFLPERRVSYTESTRRKKKIKSSNGVLNLFS